MAISKTMILGRATTLGLFVSSVAFGVGSAQPTAMPVNMPAPTGATVGTTSMTVNPSMATGAPGIPGAGTLPTLVGAPNGAVAAAPATEPANVAQTSPAAVVQPQPTNAPPVSMAAPVPVPMAAPMPTASAGASQMSPEDLAKLSSFNAAPNVGAFNRGGANSATGAPANPVNYQSAVVEAETASEKNRYKAILHTTMGDITIRLLKKYAPRTVQNFIDLAKGEREFLDPKTSKKVHRPFYTGLIFHRVIKDFLVQTGCPFGTGRGDPGYNLNDEISPNLKFEKPGMVAMALAQDKAKAADYTKNTNGSQFFISLEALPQLNGKFTIFGEVISGMDVVQKISKVHTGPTDRPIRKVYLLSVDIDEPNMMMQTSTGPIGVNMANQLPAPVNQAPPVNTAVSQVPYPAQPYNPAIQPAIQPMSAARNMPGTMPATMPGAAPIAPAVPAMPAVNVPMPASVPSSAPAMAPATAAPSAMAPPPAPPAH